MDNHESLVNHEELAKQFPGLYKTLNPVQIWAIVQAILAAIQAILHPPTPA